MTFRSGKYDGVPHDAHGNAVAYFGQDGFPPLLLPPGSSGVPVMTKETLGTRAVISTFCTALLDLAKEDERTRYIEIRDRAANGYLHLLGRRRVPRTVPLDDASLDPGWPIYYLEYQMFHMLHDVPAPT